MFIQSRWCRNQQKPDILQLPPHIFWCRSCKRSFWQEICHINIKPLKWYRHWLVLQEKPDTSRRNSNEETREMYTRVWYKNWIRNFYISIGYPIGSPSKIYYNNQETLKRRVLENIINPQARYLNVLITVTHKLHLIFFEMLDTISNMQLDYLNSKPNGVKFLIDIIDRAIRVRLYPPPLSKQ